MENDNLESAEPRTLQVQAKGTIDKKSSKLKTIIIVTLVIIGLLGVAFSAWFYYFKDLMILKEYRNESFSISVPSDGYENVDNFSSIKSIQWFKDSNDKFNQGLVTVAIFDGGAPHQKLVDNYDNGIGVDSSIYAAVEKTDKSNLLDYSYVKGTDGAIDFRKVSYIVMSDGRKAYKSITNYFIRGTDVIVLKIKAGYDNQKLINKINDIQDSFKIL